MDESVLLSLAPPLMLLVPFAVVASSWRRRAGQAQEKADFEPQVEWHGSDVAVPEPASVPGPGPQPVAAQARGLLALADVVQARILCYSGPTAWSRTACTSKELHSIVWEPPAVWRFALLHLGREPPPPGSASSTQLQDQVRRAWFGIDALWAQDPFPGSNLARREHHAALLRSARRACRGLRGTDGAATAEEVLTRCVELLSSFDVSDTEARFEAEALKDAISLRSEIFGSLQRRRVEAAFAEAMELHSLLNEALQTPADAALDDALASPQDTTVWGVAAHGDDEEDSKLDHEADTEAAIDRLIVVLRKIAADGRADPP